MSNMTLEETAAYMTSDNYKNRFIAEYMQLCIRMRKLSKLILDYRDGLLDFEPDCPIQLLEAQLSIMRIYKEILSDRAAYEHIDLPM